MNPSIILVKNGFAVMGSHLVISFARSSIFLNHKCAKFGLNEKVHFQF